MTHQAYESEAWREGATAPFPTPQVEASFLGERTPPWTPGDIELARRCGQCLTRRLKGPAHATLCAGEALPSEQPYARGTVMARLACRGILDAGGRMPVHQIVEIPYGRT